MASKDRVSVVLGRGGRGGEGGGYREGGGGEWRQVVGKQGVGRVIWGVEGGGSRWRGARGGGVG